MKKLISFGLTAGLILSICAINAKDVKFRGGIMDAADVKRVEQYEKSRPTLGKRILAALGLTQKQPISTKELDIGNKHFYRVVNETSGPISARTPWQTVRNIMPNSSAKVIHMDKQRIEIKKAHGSWTEPLRTHSHVLRITEKKIDKNKKRLEIIQTDTQEEAFYHIENRSDVQITAMTDKEGETIDPNKSARVDRVEPFIRIRFMDDENKKTRRFPILDHFIRVVRNEKGNIEIQTRP